MGAIAIAQAILIIIVSIVIFSHQHERTDSHNVDSDFNVDIPVADGSNQDVDTLTLHNITQVPTITKKNYTVDSFGTDYMTILLSLITLCATLAVVIPYLIGKIYTESQVDSKVQEAKDECQKEVENLFSQSNDNLKKESEKYRNQFEDLKNEYSKRIHDVDNAINQNIKALDVEVGHNARMISYLLSHKIGKEENELSVNVWTIGWASKALLRYTKNDYGEYFHLKKFINDSIRYIILAGNAIPNQMCKTENERDILLRALTDLYDSCVLGDINPSLLNSDVEKKKNELLQILKKLFDCIGDENLAITAICSKSKFRRNGSYEETEAYRRTVREKLKEYQILSD